MENQNEKKAFTVATRANTFKQPRGGYLSPKEFDYESLGHGIEELNPDGFQHPNLTGLAVDYLTRFMTGTPLEEAFLPSLKGAYNIDEDVCAMILLYGIKGLDKQSIINAVKLCGYDVCYRKSPLLYKDVDDPNDATIDNIRIMVNRSLAFFDKYGPIVRSGFTFEGAYTNIIRAGEGDYLTKDTIWDFKVSKNNITNKHTLQLLIYWLMGLYTGRPEFESVKYLGIFNPMLNCVRSCSIKLMYLNHGGFLPCNMFEEIETEVIGYNYNATE